VNLRDLQYLVAIDDERHFNRAAQRCFVSQPTLSGQLKKLEDELGVVLVERNTRQVVMTDVGARIADQARRVLADVKEIREIADAYHDPMTADVHTGMIPTLGPYLLPIIMPVIRKQYPKLKLWLHEHQTDELLEKLRRAELDVLILALPVGTDEFAVLDLFEETFLLAVSSSAPLAQRKAVDLDELAGQEMLLLEEGHCLREQALDVCLSAGATENSAFHAASLELLRYMVAEGMGMTFMPQLAVPAHQTRKDPVRYLPFKNPKPSRRIGMLYRKGSHREETFGRIAKAIRTAMAQKPK